MLRHVLRIGCITLLLSASLSIGFAPSVSAGDNNQVVRIARFSFFPNDFTVAPGGLIRLINYDGCRKGIPHTFTSTREGGFDSGKFFCDEPIVTAPEELGRWHFYCVIHPFMKGTLRVE